MLFEDSCHFSGQRFANDRLVRGRVEFGVADHKPMIPEFKAADQRAPDH